MHDSDIFVLVEENMARDVFFATVVVGSPVPAAKAPQSMHVNKLLMSPFIALDLHNYGTLSHTSAAGSYLTLIVDIGIVAGDFVVTCEGDFIGNLSVRRVLLSNLPLRLEKKQMHRIRLCSIYVGDRITKRIYPL